MAPPIDVLFRPEEKHGLSIEDYIVPPLPGGNSEVDESRRFGYDSAVPHADSHTLSAASAGGENPAVGAQHGNHT